MIHMLRPTIQRSTHFRKKLQYEHLMGQAVRCVPLRVCFQISFLCDAAVQSAVLETKQRCQKTAGLKMSYNPLCVLIPWAILTCFRLDFTWTERRGSLDWEFFRFPPHLSQTDFEEIYLACFPYMGSPSKLLAELQLKLRIPCWKCAKSI